MDALLAVGSVVSGRYTLASSNTRGGHRPCEPALWLAGMWRASSARKMQRLSITRRTVAPLQSARAAGVSEPHLHVLSLAAADYQEMPDLALTPRQAARLWNADESTCGEVLTGLVRAGLLRRAGDRFVRR